MVESDEEQLEVLKKWWDENGTPLLVTIVLALGGSFGYRAWENSVMETGEAASATYENLVTAVENIEPGRQDEALVQTAKSLSETIKSDYEDTTYAVFASLHMAKLAVDAGDLDTAQAELEWALGKVQEPHLETLVRTRLARVLIGKEDATAAISRLLNYKPETSQRAAYEEVLGDAYLMVGDEENARASYQRAVEALKDIQKPTLLAKLADIPPASGGVVPGGAPDAEETADAPAEDGDA